MVSEKKIVLGFPHYNTMGAIRCHGHPEFQSPKAGLILAQKIMGENCTFSINWREIKIFL